MAITDYEKMRIRQILRENMRQHGVEEANAEEFANLLIKSGIRDIDRLGEVKIDPDYFKFLEVYGVSDFKFPSRDMFETDSDYFNVAKSAIDNAKAKCEDIIKSLRQKRLNNKKDEMPDVPVFDTFDNKDDFSKAMSDYQTAEIKYDEETEKIISKAEREFAEKIKKLENKINRLDVYNRVIGADEAERTRIIQDAKDTVRGNADIGDLSKSELEYLEWLDSVPLLVELQELNDKIKKSKDHNELSGLYQVRSDVIARLIEKKEQALCHVLYGLGGTEVSKNMPHLDTFDFYLSDLMKDKIVQNWLKVGTLDDVIDAATNGSYVQAKEELKETEKLKQQQTQEQQSNNQVDDQNDIKPEEKPFALVESFSDYVNNYDYSDGYGSLQPAMIKTGDDEIVLSGKSSDDIAQLLVENPDGVVLFSRENEPNIVKVFDGESGKMLPAAFKANDVLETQYIQEKPSAFKRR